MISIYARTHDQAVRILDEGVAMFLLTRFGKKGDWKAADQRTKETYRQHARLLREFMIKWTTATVHDVGPLLGYSLHDPFQREEVSHGK